MNRCPVCSGSVEGLSPDQVVITWDREGERELVMYKFHRSCFIGDSHLSRLASMANSLGYDIKKYLRDTPKNKRDGKWEQLFDDAEALIMDAIKWIEPEE